MPGLENLQRSIESQRAQAESISASIQEAQEEKWQAEYERVEREKRILNLTQQLATAQNHLVARI